jgi:hypothetical protein
MLHPKPPLIEGKDRLCVRTTKPHDARTARARGPGPVLDHRGQRGDGTGFEEIHHRDVHAEDLADAGHHGRRQRVVAVRKEVVEDSDVAPSEYIDPDPENALLIGRARWRRPSVGLGEVRSLGWVRHGRDATGRPGTAGVT